VPAADDAGARSLMMALLFGRGVARGQLNSLEKLRIMLFINALGSLGWRGWLAEK
jgi:hypothetical protein